jgi:hypothetical protein
MAVGVCSSSSMQSSLIVAGRLLRALGVVPGIYDLLLRAISSCVDSNRGALATSSRRSRWPCMRATPRRADVCSAFGGVGSIGWLGATRSVIPFYTRKRDSQLGFGDEKGPGVRFSASTGESTPQGLSQTAKANGQQKGKSLGD